MNHAVSGTFVPGVRENMAYFTSTERRSAVYVCVHSLSRLLSTTSFLVLSCLDGSVGLENSLVVNVHPCTYTFCQAGWLSASHYYMTNYLSSLCLPHNRT